MTSEPLTPAVFYVLTALGDGDKHGYAITRFVEEQTQNQVRLGPGTLYGTIKRLLALGWVEESGDRPAEDDPRRRYYRITNSGGLALNDEVHRLEGMLHLAGRLRPGAI